MGKIKILISTTPDGFAEAQNVIIDQEFFTFTQSLLLKAAVVAFGRTTFEQFQDRWTKRLEDVSSPGWIIEMAQSMHQIDKVVFSSTLKSTYWNNSKILNRLDAGYIQSFKDNSKGDLLIFGSLSVVELLIEMNLVDDYYFNIQPIISGKGNARFFKKLNLNSPLPLKYMDLKQMASGAHILHYQSIK